MALTRPRAAQIYNIDYKQATRVVTITNITLAGGAPSLVDGVSLNLNDRVLVTGQSTGSQNGLYFVSTVGSGANGTWTRSSDNNQTGELLAGTIVMVTEGTTYADTQWKLITDDPINIGSTALTFTQNYSANSISGGTSNVIVYSNANVTISSAGTANVLTVSSTGIVVAGTASATGNITGSFFIGNGSQLTGINGGSSSYSNSNVTSLLAAFGSNTISTTGTINSGNITGGNILTSGLVSASGTITGTSHVGAVVSVTGAVTAASVVGGVITGSSTSVTGAQTAASTVGGVITGSSVSVAGAISGASASVSGGVTAASVAGGVITGTSTSVSGGVTAASVAGGVITGSSLSVSGTVTGTAHNGTSISVTGGVTAASVSGGVITGSSTSVTGAQTAASTVGGVITGSSVSVSGAVTGGALTGSSLTVTTGSVTAGSIVNGNANGVGNIGSSALYFNTVFAKATSAQYADLAEMYCGDANYTPGTVVEFGGAKEITATTESHSTRVAGIISTNPSYLMNSTLDCENALEVALVGRVPCSVVGTIRKGDRLVSSDLPGVATALDIDQYQPGCIVAKALEDYNSAEPGVIEVAVGRT